MMKKLLNVLLHPVSISLFLTIPVLLLLPPIKKYNADLVTREKNREGHTIYYVDLDKDGDSEKININNNYENQVSLVVSNNHKIINQWNFDGVLVFSQSPFWADIKNENNTLIFLFTFRENAIWLHCVDPLNKKMVFIDKRVSDYDPPSAGLDCSVKPVGFYDNDKDGIKEFYFSIISGFNSSPRRMYVFNFADTTLNSSPKGCLIFKSPFAVDINNDGVLEFGSSTMATGNCDSLSELSDYYTWFCLLDNNMDFIFKPVQVGHYPSQLQIVPLVVGNEVKFVLLDIYMGDQNYPCSISIFNGKGQVEKRNKFDYDESWDKTILLNYVAKYPNTFFVQKTTGLIERKNTDLITIDTKQFIPLHFTSKTTIDIDADGKEEIVLVGRDREQLVLTRENFNDEVLIDIN